jgi:hypothetical protein
MSILLYADPLYDSLFVAHNMETWKEKCALALDQEKFQLTKSKFYKQLIAKENIFLKDSIRYKQNLDDIRTELTKHMDLISENFWRTKFGKECQEREVNLMIEYSKLKRK